MSRRRVVVTGLGIVSPIGNTVAEAWDSALAGKSGITRITRFDPSRLACQIAGEVKGFDVVALHVAEGSAAHGSPSSTTASPRRCRRGASAACR